MQITGQWSPRETKKFQGLNAGRSPKRPCQHLGPDLTQLPREYMCMLLENLSSVFRRCRSYPIWRYRNIWHRFGLRSLLNGPYYIFGSPQALSRPLQQSADPIGTLKASTRTLMVSRTFSATKSPFHDLHKHPLSLPLQAFWRAIHFQNKILWFSCKIVIKKATSRWIFRPVLYCQP